VLLGLRAAPEEDSGLSSAELVFGAPLSLPGGLLEVGERPPEVFMEQLRAAPHPPAMRPLTHAQAMASVPQSLRQAKFVYTRKGGTVEPLLPLYAGPYKVIRRSDKFFYVEVGGREVVVLVDRLKRHLGSAMLQPAQPPLHGRPPGPAVRSSP
jgi:hypothetical protein